jgi:uncharacterized protein
MSDTTKATPTLEMLREKRDEILAIAARNRASNVRVFGSVARGDATADSDIDLLVDFEVGASLYDLSRLRLELIELLGIEVDVVSDHAGLRERFRNRVYKEALPL